MRTVLTAEKLWDGTSLHRPSGHRHRRRPDRLNRTRAEVEIPATTAHRELSRRHALPRHFFDVHIHGAAGHDVMEATPEALDTIGRFLASRGTGSFLATTVTAPLDATLRALAGLAKLIASRPLRRACRPPHRNSSRRPVSLPRQARRPSAEYLLAPDIAIFDRLFDAAEGHVRLMTLAPELPGAAELAAHAIARGVRVSVGHSNATAAETRAAIAAGAVSATHTFNAMRPLDHREPGILGAVLTTDSLFAELICDGIHTAPEMVKLWWKSKGPERAILVTDAMSATGMPDGEYQLGGFAVQVTNGRATWATSSPAACSPSTAPWPTS